MMKPQQNSLGPLDQERDSFVALHQDFPEATVPNEIKNRIQIGLELI